MDWYWWVLIGWFAWGLLFVHETMSAWPLHQVIVFAPIWPIVLWWELHD